MIEATRPTTNFAYTSSVDRLLCHIGRLLLIKENSIWRPITLHVSPTDECNMACIFCSVQNRGHSVWNFQDLISALQSFKALGIGAVEITGGGDPTQYPYINELIEYLTRDGDIQVEKGGSRRLSVGLITNGVELRQRVKYEMLARLTWLRISLNCLDYVNSVDLRIPENVTLGFSYVWNDLTVPSTLEKVSDYARRFNAAYVRVVPNCYDAEEIERVRVAARPVLEKYKNFSLVIKNYAVPESCTIGYLKPFLYSDGYVYHCSTHPLFSGRFSEKFRMGHYTEVNSIWNHIAPLNPAELGCDKCFYSDHNAFLAALVRKPPHKEFI